MEIRFHWVAQMYIEDMPCISLKCSQRDNMDPTSLPPPSVSVLRQSYKECFAKQLKLWRYNKDKQVATHTCTLKTKSSCCSWWAFFFFPRHHQVRRSISAHVLAHGVWLALRIMFSKSVTCKSVSVSQEDTFQEWCLFSLRWLCVLFTLVYI